MVVYHQYVNVEPIDPSNSTLPGATFPSSTLPGATLPGTAYYKGLATGAHIFYRIEWTPPNDAHYIDTYSSTILAHVANSQGVASVVPSNVVSFQLISGATTFQLPMVVGFNLVAIPVNVATALNTTTPKATSIRDSIAAQGGTVTSIQRWGVGGAQGFDGWSAALPGTNNFAINSGEGYFVRLTGAPSGGNWSLTGPEASASVPLNFVVGFNLIGVPFMTPGSYTASTLAAVIDAAGGTVTSIQRWGVGGAQGFDGWSAALPATNDFPIEKDEGYFVRSSAIASGVNP